MVLFQSAFLLVGFLSFAGLAYGQADSSKLYEYPRGLHKLVWKSSSWSYRTLGPVFSVHPANRFGYEVGIGLARVRGTYKAAAGYNINLTGEHFPGAGVAGAKLNVWTGFAIVLPLLGVGLSSGYYFNYEDHEEGLCVRPEIGMWARGFALKYGMNLNNRERLNLPLHMLTLQAYFASWTPEKKLRRIQQ